MIYCVLRQRNGAGQDEEPLALVRFNVKEFGNLVVGAPTKGRFGWQAPCNRSGLHVYNLMLGDHEDVRKALESVQGWRLEEVTRAEWESWSEMELFPVLRTAIVDKGHSEPMSSKTMARLKHPGRFSGGAFGKGGQRKRR